MITAQALLLPGQKRQVTRGTEKDKSPKKPRGEKRQVPEKARGKKKDKPPNKRGLTFGGCGSKNYVFVCVGALPGKRGSSK